MITSHVIVVFSFFFADVRDVLESFSSNGISIGEGNRLTVNREKFGLESGTADTVDIRIIILSLRSIIRLSLCVLDWFECSVGTGKINDVDIVWIVLCRGRLSFTSRFKTSWGLDSLRSSLNGFTGLFEVVTIYR
jgi:hypothetical protein